MSKYGKVAVGAVGLLKAGKTADPVDAWEEAAAEAFPDRPASRKKGCPRGAFLGLCGAGLVSGIAPGSYTASKRSATYAVKAASLVMQNPRLAAEPEALWRLVLDGVWIKHNEQMDVVLALWHNGLLHLPPGRRGRQS
jgi:hypothetical protein